MNNRTLYHCITSKAEGSGLKPKHCPSFYKTIPSSLRDKLGICQGEPPLLFAAIRKSLALCYALSVCKGKMEGSQLNIPIPDSNAQLTLLTNRDQILARKLEASVYAFSDHGFIELEGMDQCVSLEEVPFSRTTVVLRPRSILDLMQEGLQVLTFPKANSDLWRDSELYPEGEKEHLFIRLQRMPNPVAYLSTLLKDGKIVWENKVFDIRPDPVLAGKFDQKNA